MGHTNETANVELSQFLSTDKPAWLVDYNGDMAKIDAYAYATRVKANANESAITSLSNRVGTIENDITNVITPALTSAQNNITTLQGNITTINSLIGNGTPTTTDQTIIGAINEINGKLMKYVDLTNVTLSANANYKSSIPTTRHIVSAVSISNDDAVIDLMHDYVDAVWTFHARNIYRSENSTDGFAYANTAVDIRYYYYE